MKYAMFIGRWQPFHKGHMWLVDQQLQLGKNILLAIRDVEPDEKQPFTALQVKEMIDTVYRGNERVKSVIIPDIESVNYGRGVGYEVIEHKPDANVASISATMIRQKIKNEDNSWREYVDSSIQVHIEAVLGK